MKFTFRGVTIEGSPTEVFEFGQKIWPEILATKVEVRDTKAPPHVYVPVSDFVRDTRFPGEWASTITYPKDKK